ncbi:MAG: hypothetical protein ABSG86_32130, partial [Thermoguttaceae bacterium]
MLPQIVGRARISFRYLNPEARAEAVQEVVCNALKAFVRLVQLKKVALAYPTVLAKYGVAQTRDHRKVGGHLNVKDVMSPYCQRLKRVVVERLDHYDDEEDAWQEAVVVDTRWAQLGRSLSGRERPSRSLFHPPHYDDPSDDEPVLVNVRDVRLERLRDFGDVWMAWGLGRLLGLDTLLEGLAASGREAVPWPTVAAILTIARLCEPSSELHVETTWYRRTALEDLLGVSVEKVHT